MISPVIFQAAPINRLHPSLARYLASSFAQSVRHNDADPEGRGYVATVAGRQQVCGGLTRLLRARYYPNYKDNRSKRGRRVLIKGSSSAQGIQVDTDIGDYIAGNKTVEAVHPMARALIERFEGNGHILQAAQVPVQIEPGRITQADFITLDTRTNKLWLAECKTGIPIGLHTKQGVFKQTYRNVDNTKLNQWHLQLLYTKRSLIASGVDIAESRVVQIYEKRKKRTPAQKGKRLRGSSTDLIIKEHVPPAWTASPQSQHYHQPTLMKMKVLNTKKRRIDDDSAS